MHDVLNAVRAAVFLLCHLAIAFLIVAGIYGLEKFISYLWGQHEPMMIGILPLKYLFEAIDLCIIVVFGFRGIVAALRAFRG